MKGARDIRPFITELQSQRVIEPLSDRVTPLPLPMVGGEIFLMPIKKNSDTRFASRGIIIKFGIKIPRKVKKI